MVTRVHTAKIIYGVQLTSKNMTYSRNVRQNLTPQSYVCRLTYLNDSLVKLSAVSYCISDTS